MRGRGLVLSFPAQASPQSSAGTAYTEMANGDSFRWLVLTVSMMLWSGCSLQPLQQQIFGDLGRIEHRTSQSDVKGIVVGVPHGIAEAAAIDYASTISAATGAGLVVAYGFGAKRVPVTQPLIHGIAFKSTRENTRRGGSIYSEFKDTLRAAANGPVKLYVGIRIAGAESQAGRIEVASSGLSFAQLRALKETFLRHRDRALADTDIERAEIAIEPLDQISWNVAGFKHHGVLMLAERGLNLRLPASLASGAAKRVYKNILGQWIHDAVTMAMANPAMLPRVDVVVLQHGKIELIPSAGLSEGIVVAAPHVARSTCIPRKWCDESARKRVLPGSLPPASRRRRAVTVGA